MREVNVMEIAAEIEEAKMRRMKAKKEGDTEAFTKADERLVELATDVMENILKGMNSPQIQWALERVENGLQRRTRL